MTDVPAPHCRDLGAEPYICLNMGSGTLEEALSWIEYCNGDRRTYWADKRRENGHERPHAVHWWGLGNEMYGEWQTGGMSGEEYTSEAIRWGRAIKTLDPSVGLVSCGEVGWTDWDAKVIRRLAPLVDLHSIHVSTGSDDYWSTVLSPHICERAIDVAAAELRRAAYLEGLKQPPRVVYDEWNVWFRAMTSSLEERYVPQDALAVGTFLNIFVRKCQWVAMANLAQMVNAIAPIVTTPEAAVVQPIYYPILLHAQGHLAQAVDCHVDGPTLEAPEDLQTRWPHRIDDLDPFTLVDAAATVDEQRRAVAVTLVNRSEEDERVELRLRDASFAGPARVRTVGGHGRPSAVPGVESVDVAEGTEDPSGGSLVLVLPAKSFTLIEGGLAS